MTVNKSQQKTEVNRTFGPTAFKVDLTCQRAIVPASNPSTSAIRSVEDIGLLCCIREQPRLHLELPPPGTGQLMFKFNDVGNVTACANQACASHRASTSSPAGPRNSDDDTRSRTQWLRGACSRGVLAMFHSAGFPLRRPSGLIDSVNVLVESTAAKTVKCVPYQGR